MPKIRVYELARELNMKNKVLMDKLIELKIAVSSHMSSLEDDAVVQVKAFVRGKTVSGIEEKRIQNTVIRRRKTRAADHLEDMEPDAADRLSPESLSVADSQPALSETADADEPVDKPVARIDLSIAGEKPVEMEPEISPVAVSEKSEELENISADEFEETAKEEETAQMVLPQIQDAPDEDADTEYPIEEVIQIRKESPEQTEDVPEALLDGLPESDADSVSTGVVETPGDAGEADRKSEVKSAKKKKKKKGKKDTPAKIIKLPPKIVEPEVVFDETVDTEKATDAVEVVGELVSTEPAAEAAPDEDAEARREKKKKKTEDRETRWAKKKISFKDKEVVEGEALYAKSRGKKGKKGGKSKEVKAQKTLITTPKAIKRRIKIDETIVLSDLAKRMGIKASEMIKKLLMLGIMATVNQTIDFETAVLVASEFEYEVEKASFEEESVMNLDESDDPDKMAMRPPVVTIMGHVDHGKTSLLDVIRTTRVTEIEAGGITQHIGAYSVSTDGGQITFLDTPGHEAFTAMRARGATVTDIVVLVVAADDGVMPQTIEAINHAKVAGVPIIVAINKMDKPGADPDRVMRELADQGLVPEDWGGDTIFVKVSAKQKWGITELLEMILLQAEVLELKANPEKHARGYVVESKLDAGRGPVATILIQEGTLRAGDPVVCGVHHGKIRAMLNDVGNPVKEAGPSIPIEVLGLTGVPNAGEELLVLEDDKSAKQVSEHRVQKQRSIELAKTSRMSLEKLFERMKDGEVKELNVIIKADVHGSLEALNDSLTKLSNEEVTIRVIHSATGTVTESDISLAAVSNAIIIGFNIRPSLKIQSMAQEENVDMRFYNIIYNVIKDVKDAILGMMDSTYEDRVLGQAEVRQVFHVPKVGAVAGCYVIDGKIQRGFRIRLIRDGVIIHDGKIASLRRFKDDAREVMSGYECGIGIESFNDIKVGDIIECYYLEEIKPEI